MLREYTVLLDDPPLLKPTPITSSRRSPTLILRPPAPSPHVSGESPRTTNKYSLTVSIVPSDSRIRIMNIRPRYHPGIKLSPGKYKIRVDKKGYKTYEKWLVIDDHDVIFPVVLEKQEDVVTYPFEKDKSESVVSIVTQEKPIEKFSQKLEEVQLFDLNFLSWLIKIAIVIIGVVSLVFFIRWVLYHFTPSLRPQIPRIMAGIIIGITVGVTTTLIAYYLFGSPETATVSGVLVAVIAHYMMKEA